MIDATEHLKVIEAKNADARIDSRILAEHLGVQHQNTFEMLKDYKADFEQLGILRFETGIFPAPDSPAATAQTLASLNVGPDSRQAAWPCSTPFKTYQ